MFVDSESISEKIDSEKNNDFPQPFIHFHTLKTFKFIFVHALIYPLLVVVAVARQQSMPAYGH